MDQEQVWNWPESHTFGPERVCEVWGLALWLAAAKRAWLQSWHLSDLTASLKMWQFGVACYLPGPLSHKVEKHLCWAASYLKRKLDWSWQQILHLRGKMRQFPKAENGNMMCCNPSREHLASHMKRQLHLILFAFRFLNRYFAYSRTSTWLQAPILNTWRAFNFLVKYYPSLLRTKSTLRFSVIGSDNTIQ